MKIMHCPQHEGTQLVHNLNSVKHLQPRSVGFTEMDFGNRDVTGLVKKVLSGYRVCAMDKGGHSREIPIAVRTSLIAKVQSVELFQLSHDIPGLGIGNDRWMNVVRFRVFRHNYFHVATHWNAVLQDSHGLVHVDRNRRAAAMVEAFHVMRKKLVELKNEDREGFVTGDFNYRVYNDSLFKLWEYSPQSLFKSVNMHWHEEGLDYLAWTKGMKLAHDKIRIIPRGEGMNLSDHPWILGTFKRA